MTCRTFPMTSIIHPLVIHSNSYVHTCVVRLYLLISTTITTWKRLIRIGPSYTLHYRCTYSEYYNNTSSDEFQLYFLSKRIWWILAWGLYREQDPRHPRRSATPTLHKLGCLPPLSYTLTSFRSFSQGFTSSWHTKKGKNLLCWKDLRFMFKFSWNLWEHWGAISHLHWHLISQEESESTNCQGFPVCPIILHQFPWPYGLLVN